MTPSNQSLNGIDGHHALGWVPFDVTYSVGASGALTAVRNGGITSITRTGAGAYTIVLDAKYIDIYNMNATVSGTYDRTNGTIVWMNTVGTDATTGLTSITIEVYVDSGAGTTKTDILSGNVLRMTFAGKSLAAGSGGGP